MEKINKIQENTLLTNRTEDDNIMTEILQLNWYSFTIDSIFRQKKMDILMDRCIFLNRIVSETNKMQEFWHA